MLQCATVTHSPGNASDRSREVIEFDVVIVGGGPAGLSAAWRLVQMAEQAGRTIDVCVVEKGSEIGAHIISGAVIETRALDELCHDWRERGAPVSVEVSDDRWYWLTGKSSGFRVPAAFVPRSLRNEGRFIVSLGELCQWLAVQAERLGCQILPAVAATELLIDEEGRIAGVATGAMGLDREGRAKPGAVPGYELRAKHVIFAEGCRGSLARELFERFDLAALCEPQHYGIGFKEIWEVDPDRHSPGRVEHTLGWPLDLRTEGGGFIYHGAGQRVAVGMVISLAYRNPYLDPFKEFQRFKHHPRVRAVLESGTRIAYGARVVNKGGFASLPKLVVPGGVIVGCAAGFLNPAKIKGTHTAMKTGMLAAEAVFEALSQDDGGAAATAYSDAVRASWVWRELHATRHFAPGIAKFGPIGGGALAFVEQNLLGRGLPLRLRNTRRDREMTLPAARAARIDYPAPDGQLSFDRLSSVHLANTSHDEDQPVHLKLVDASVPVELNLPEYDEPAQRYCPAAVYEIVRDTGGAARLQVNAANCIHCKCCDIKDPTDNIRWSPPEGGGGPNYAHM
jgi:electron-transferring-flavoprotein dehydrogenase